MKIILPKEVSDIINKFKAVNYQIYIVGGAVRDLLLKTEVNDWDFTTDATPEQILELFPDGFNNNQFGTVGIKFTRGDSEEGSTDTPTANKMSEEGSGETEEAGPRVNTKIFEITTMRKEGDYKDHRHPVDIGWTDKIEEDLERRDFTINAMALDVIASRAKQSHKIIDPFNGQDDLNKKLIKAVGDPDLRFKEDALRLLRAIRLSSQLNFEIEDKTFKSVQKNKDLITEISWERIRDEFFKLLSSDNPYEGILKLRESGIFQIILPELEECFGLVQEGPKHDRVYDIGEHSLLSLKFCPSKDPLVRFATLIHDIGKPNTKNVQKDGNVTFYGHDVVGAKIAKKICERFKLSNKDTEKVISLIRWHLFAVDEHQTDAAIRRFIKNIGLENISDMFALRVGDRLGGGTPKAVSWRMKIFLERIEQVLQKPFSISDLKISGTEVMEILNIPPGPKVGLILNELFQEVLEDATKNNKEYLTEKVKSIPS